MERFLDLLVMSVGRFRWELRTFCAHSKPRHVVRAIPTRAEDAKRFGPDFCFCPLEVASITAGKPHRWGSGGIASALGLQGDEVALIMAAADDDTADRTVRAKLVKAVGLEEAA